MGSGVTPGEWVDTEQLRHDLGCEEKRQQAQVGPVGDTVGGRAGQVILEEVALVADDDEVEVAFAGVADDQLGRVPR